MATVADRLRELRNEKGLSLEEVGQCIGVGRANIYKYEHGLITNIPPDKLHTLANLFGVSRPYLMGWTDDRSQNPSANLDTVAEKLRIPAGELKTQDNDVFWTATSMKEADCVTAATQAARALIKFGITRTPVYPQRILQESQYTTVITFDKASELDDIILNSNMLVSYQMNNMVMSSAYVNSEGQDKYLFVVDRNAPLGKLKLALAVDIGHIYLGHASRLRDKTRKRKEAECFAIHLVFPRALIKLLQERGYVFTEQSFQRIFGDCEWCLDSMLNAEPVRISSELNHLVKEQFTPYVNALEEIGILSIPAGNHKILDFSRYMAGYED